MRDALDSHSAAQDWVVESMLGARDPWLQERYARLQERRARLLRSVKFMPRSTVRFYKSDVQEKTIKNIEKWSETSFYCLEIAKGCLTLLGKIENEFTTSIYSFEKEKTPMTTFSIEMQNEIKPPG